MYFSTLATYVPVLAFGGGGGGDYVLGRITGYLLFFGFVVLVIRSWMK